jgi:hypothetical protein
MHFLLGLFGHWVGIWAFVLHIIYYTREILYDSRKTMSALAMGNLESE